jgi:hypothetical protein
MDRRTVLKASVTLALLAPVAKAEIPEVSAVRKLIASFHKADKAANAAQDVYSAIRDDPHRPNYPKLDTTEISYRYRPLGMPKTIFGVAQIDQVMDGNIRQAEMMRDLCSSGEAEYPSAPEVRQKAAQAHQKKLDDIEEERGRLKSIFQERMDTYARWEQMSGAGAAMIEACRLGDIAQSIEEDILKFDCKTLDDVRAVAAYIADEFKGEFHVGGANAFIARLASKTLVEA